jgi:hypothetical protein
MSSRARRTAVLVLLAVFLAGGMAGWVLEDVVEDVDWPAQRGERHGGSPDRADDPLDDDAEEDFLETLGLPREQLKIVDSLLDEREHRLETYWRTRLPDIEAVIDSTRTAIRDLLTADQRAAYDSWLEQQRTRTYNP